MRTKKKKITITADGDQMYQARHLDRVHATGDAIVLAYDKSTILAAGNSVVRAYGSATIIGTEQATIIVFSEEANIELHDFAVLIDRIDEKPIVSIAKNNVVKLFTEGKR